MQGVIPRECEERAEKAVRSNGEEVSPEDGEVAELGDFKGR